MTLAEEYDNQNQWRNWHSYIKEIPIKNTDLVLDLGCGTGHVSRLLAERCLQVIGVDGNEELLEIAKLNNQSGNLSFVNADLSSPAPIGLPRADGIWCSFTAAYFPNFEQTLSRWLLWLKPGGWIALVEIDHLLGHQPLSPETESLFKAHYKRLRKMMAYDFEMGSKLKDVVIANGLVVISEQSINDPELAFNGPADAAVITAWQNRLDRMTGLKKAVGDDQFRQIKNEFLTCLKSDKHQCSASVKFVIASNDPVYRKKRDDV